MEALPYRKTSSSLVFLIVLGAFGLTLLLSRWSKNQEEGWLAECSDNLEIIAAAQAERIQRGEGYLACPPWPGEVPSGPTRWDRSDRRCCREVGGTWESLCDLDLADDPEAAQGCWAECVESQLQADPTEVSGDWAHTCCSRCGAQRVSRCTACNEADPRCSNLTGNGQTIAENFAACTERDRSADEPGLAAEVAGPDPPACWWDLGFEPGVSLRGRYQVNRDVGRILPNRDVGRFLATCSIRRNNGEVVDFETVGRMVLPEPDIPSP